MCVEVHIKVRICSIVHLNYIQVRPCRTVLNVQMSQALQDCTERTNVSGPEGLY